MHKLQALPQSDGTQCGRAAALVLTGALNPVHVGHVASLVGARAALEKRGWKVVAGWLSPSHDSYVRPKMMRSGGLFLSTPTRVRCVELAVADTDWIACGRWESMGLHSSWPDFPVVVASLQDHLCAIGHSDVTVFFVCGYDHYLKCGLRNGMRRRNTAVPAPGLAVLPRDGSRPISDSDKAPARTGRSSVSRGSRPKCQARKSGKCCGVTRVAVAQRQPPNRVCCTPPWRCIWIMMRLLSSSTVRAAESATALQSALDTLHQFFSS